MIFLSSRNRNSSSIWHMIANGMWDELKQLMVVERRVGLMPSGKQVRYDPALGCRVALLQFCLAHGAPEDIIHFLLEINDHRQGLSIPDKFGRLPLHIACAYQANSKTIVELVMAFPRALVVQDKKGNIPLHYAVIAACGHRQPTAHMKTTLSAKSYPSTASTSSSVFSQNSDTIAIKRDCLDIVSYLLLSAPTSVVVVNHDVDTPLSLAMRLEDGYKSKTSEQTPVYNLLSSVATSVLHNWEVHRQQTDERINQMTGLYDESLLERRKPEILSTSLILRHYLFGRR